VFEPSPGKSIIFTLGLSLSSDETAGGLELAGHLEKLTPQNLNAPLHLNAPLNLLLCTRDCYQNSLQIYRVAAINPEFFSSFFYMGQHSWKSSDFIEVKKIRRDTYWESTYTIKLPSAEKTALIRHLKLMQVFARVSLARDPITSLI
jgi:hypothetical protein